MELDHTQIVTRVTHRAIWVAQHSRAYNKPLKSVLNSLRDPYVYVIVHPVRTVANIYPLVILMTLSKTANETASRSAWWITVGVCLTGMAVVSVLGAFAVHQACYHPPPPVITPDPSTPRGGYCAQVESLHLWPFLTGVPIVLTCLALLVSWRHVRIALALTAIIATAVLVNAFVVHQLESAVTI